jgi:hypothetical protein
LGELCEGKLHAQFLRGGTGNGPSLTQAPRQSFTRQLFHREVKSYLGFEDAGLTRFEAIHAHVLWVYSAYLLLPDLTPDIESGGVLARKQHLQKLIRKEEMGQILKLNSRFDSNEAVKSYCSQVKEKLEAA